MKKILKSILLITIVVACICGCKWKGEAQEKREAIEKEFSIWLSEHYTEYKIKSVKEVKDAEIIIPYDTEFYRITVKINGKNILFIYNSLSKEVWSNEYWQTVNNDYQNKVINALSIPKGSKQDINITSKISSIKQSDNQVLPYGVTKLDDIKEVKNKLNLSCNITYDKQIDFSSANIGRLYNTVPIDNCSIQIQLEKPTSKKLAKVYYIPEKWVSVRNDDLINVYVEHNTYTSIGDIIYEYNNYYYKLDVKNIKNTDTTQVFDVTLNRICKDNEVNYKGLIPNNNPGIEYYQDGAKIVWNPNNHGKIELSPDTKRYYRYFYYNNKTHESKDYQVDYLTAESFYLDEDYSVVLFEGDTYLDIANFKIILSKDKDEYRYWKN